MNIRTYVVAILLLGLALSGHAQILPFLGSNEDRATVRTDPVGDPIGLKGAQPAVADLGFVGNRPADRRYAAAWLEKRLGNFGVGSPELSVVAAVIDGRGTLVAGPQRLASYVPEFSGAVPGNPAIAVDGANFFTVVWSVTERTGTDNDFDQRLVARTFWPFEDTRAGSSGNLCPADGLPVLDSAPNDPSSVVFDTVETVILSNLPGDFDLQTGITTGPPFSIDTVMNVDAAASAAGRTVMVFSDHRGPSNWRVYSVATELQSEELPQGEQACEFDSASLSPVQTALEIARDAEFRAAPRVAINPNNEQAVVVWRSKSGSIQAQRLDPSGNLRGDRIVVVTAPENVQESVHDPDVDFGVDGNFNVVWERQSNHAPSANQPAFNQILMSRFDGNGSALEENLEIDRDDGFSFTTFRSQRDPRLRARDLDGNLAVTWTRQGDECPIDGELDQNGAIFDGCAWNAGDGGEMTVIAPARGRCALQFLPTGTVPVNTRCRLQVRVLPFEGASNFSRIRLAEDEPSNWDDFGSPDARGWISRQTYLEFNAAHPSLESCARLAFSDDDQGRARTIRHRCTSGDCVTCEEQAQAAGVPLPVPDEPASGKDNGASGNPPRGAAPAGDNVLIQWLQRNWRAVDATPVPAFIVNDVPLTGGAPALGMGRDGDMMVAWSDASADPASLVTQNFARPVELQINDIGILEAGQTRATANFTVTASKGYPVLAPGDCATASVPSVSLLTADGSATFQAPTDYERTTGVLDFAAGCGQLREESVSLPFSVPVLDDLVFEGTESFFVNLFDEANAIVVRRQGAAAIIDNDPAELVGFPDAQIEICEDGAIPAPLGIEPRCAEGGGDGPGFVEIRVALSDPQEVEGTAEFQTFDGTSFGNIDGAEAGSDYESVTGELQFLPRVTEAFLSINLEDDGVAELDEVFVVELIGSENLTLPTTGALPADLVIQVDVIVIDDDVCENLPQWHLPEAGVPPRVPPLGTDEERSGYFCVTNPDGFEACPWRSDLVLDAAQAPWLTLTDLQFATDPSDPAVLAAQTACQAVPGTTGAIRYLAAPNEPPSTGQPVQSRRQTVAFLNGESPPGTRDVEQSGGECEPVLDPLQAEFFPAGGEVEVQVSFGGDPACEFIAWTAQSEVSWLSLADADASGQVTAGGPGTIRVLVAPFDVDPGTQTLRTGTIDVNGTDFTIVQEAPLFDHFDDGVVPNPLEWSYLRPDAWTEAGTHLTANATVPARILATPVFAGCSDCELNASVRFDSFGKGTATVYMWWRSDDDYLALTVDEFFDTWTLVQRVGGVDHELRRFSSNVLVGDEYAVRMAFQEVQGQPLIVVDVAGEAMCPLPGPGLQACEPWRPDPGSAPVVGSGTVGLAAEAGRVSFNLLRVLRGDGLDTPLPPVDVVFADDFESPGTGTR